MSILKVVWTAASVISILIALLTTYNVMTGGWELPFGRLGPFSGDDDPIIVSGGSLTIQSRFGLKEHGGNAYWADHAHTKRKLREVDISYGTTSQMTDSQTVSSGPYTVALTYCPDSTCASSETVTFAVDNHRQNLNVQNAGGSSGVGAEANSNGKYINHVPTTWHVYKIRAGAKTYPCDSSSAYQCQAILYYHCGTTGDCQ
ncbi:MAG TPA: hypothetical protein VN736_12955 [Candidatus Limnocylindrales bacterium]|nr:hypothetical protein [Candidatus Limnocylindrales bacterium]